MGRVLHARTASHKVFTSYKRKEPVYKLYIHMTGQRKSMCDLSIALYTSSAIRANIAARQRTVKQKEEN